MAALRFRLSPLCLCIASALPSLTLAGGLDLPTLSASQQGTSNANAAEANDPTVIFYNPAGMVRLRGINVTNTGSILTIHGKVEDLGTTGTPPPTANNTQDGAKVANPGPAGSFWPGLLAAAGIAATAQVDDNITLGVGIFAPGGGKLDYKYNWSGANFIKSLDIEVVNINPSMAIRFDRQHSIGLGVSAIVGHAAQKAQIDVVGVEPYLLRPLVTGFNPNVGGIANGLAPNVLTDQLKTLLGPQGVALGANASLLTPTQQGQLSGLLAQQLLDQKSTGSARIGLLGFGFGYNLGYLFQYDDKTRLSIAYRSESKVRLHGDLKWDIGNIKTNNGLVLPDPNNGQLLNAEQYLRRYFRPDTDANSTLTLPARLSISGFRQLTDKIDVMFDYTFIQTSVNNEIAITFAPQMGGADGKTVINQGPASVHLNWKDSFKASVGANYHVDDKLVLRTGFQYDQTPVPGAKDRFPGAPDSDRFMYSIGAGYKINKTMTADIAYSYIMLADSLSDYRDACRGIYKEQGSGLSNDPGSCTGNGGTFRGRFYDTTIQVLSAQLNKKF